MSQIKNYRVLHCAFTAHYPPLLMWQSQQTIPRQFDWSTFCTAFISCSLSYAFSYAFSPFHSLMFRVIGSSCGLRVGLRPSPDPRQLGAPAAGARPGVQGGVRSASRRTRTHRGGGRPPRLRCAGGAGARHSVSGDRQRAARLRRGESHVCQGLHSGRSAPPCCTDDACVCLGLVSFVLFSFLSSSVVSSFPAPRGGGKYNWVLLGC